MLHLIMFEWCVNDQICFPLGMYVKIEYNKGCHISKSSQNNTALVC